MGKIKKAVITAAGRGTRFLPVTKSIPKELLPIGNQPSTYYLLKECYESGITDVAFVIRERNNLIEQYYKRDQELEDYLKDMGKEHMIAEIANADFGMNVSFHEQPKNLPYGNGTPFFAVKDWVGEDDFVFMFGDDLFISEKPAMLQLIEGWDENPGLDALLGTVTEEDDAIIGKLGIVKFAPGEEDKQVGKLSQFVEKPSREELFSNQALIGRAAFSPQIFAGLDTALANRPEGRELFLWDGAWACHQTNPIAALKLEGKWRTTGNPELMAAATKDLLEYYR